MITELKDPQVRNEVCLGNVRVCSVSGVAGADGADGERGPVGPPGREGEDNYRIYATVFLVLDGAVCKSSQGM